MKNLRSNYGHRRGAANDMELIRQGQFTGRSSVKFRNSVATDYQLDPEKEQLHSYKNRFSFNMLQNRKVPKFQDPPVLQPHSTILNLRNTLSLLQQKIECAKQSLQSNKILGKTIIMEVEEDDDSKNQQLHSFNESAISRISHNIQESMINLESQRKFISSLHHVELVDLAKVKTYYHSELAAALSGKNDKALMHLAYSWQIISSVKMLPQPSIAQLQQKAVSLLCHQRDMFKKTLVLDLDQTLVHCEWQRKSKDDIDITFPLESGERRTAYLAIRPHAMSFLKKMSRKFQIIIFTQRPKSQADIILDQMDQQHQLIRHRLYRNSCIQLQSGIFLKDLRIINREMKNVVMVDDVPYSYINQLDNAVPMLPYTTGNDCQLYALQKYLQEVIRADDVRVINRRSFQLGRYGEFGEACEAARCLYFKRE